MAPDRRYARDDGLESGERPNVCMRAMRALAVPSFVIAVSLLAATGAFAASGSAHAQGDREALFSATAPDPGAAEGGAEQAGSVSVAFAGGLMMPREALAETRSTGLTAGLMVALNARSGLGLAISAEYAPLPPASSGRGLSSRESHVGAATLAPRFTIGRGAIRTWLAAGAGVIVDYQEMGVAGTTVERDFTYEPVAAGALGLELHAFDSGGLVFMGRYARSFSDPAYEMITATGGLVLEF
jgi:hypothetical protein